MSSIVYNAVCKKFAEEFHYEGGTLVKMAFSTQENEFSGEEFFFKLCEKRAGVYSFSSEREEYDPYIVEDLYYGDITNPVAEVHIPPTGSKCNLLTFPHFNYKNEFIQIYIRVSNI